MHELKSVGIKIAKSLFPQSVRTSVKRRYWRLLSQSTASEPYIRGKYPAGINLTGYIRAELGVGEACRRMASILEKSALPYCIVNCPIEYNARDNDHSFDRRISEAKYSVNLVQINADIVPRAHVTLGRDYWDGRYKIAHFVWELPQAPEQWAQSCRLFDEIWTPTTFCTEAFSRLTDVPVCTIPYCIEPNIETERNRAYFELPEDKFLFLCMFDVNSVMQRKNPIGVLHAYRKAFTNYAGADHIGLVIKINSNGHMSREVTELYREINSLKNVFIIDQVLCKNDVNALIKCCDSFVSLHRSEGFGLVPAEAMYFEKPVIATNWSGNTDFMNENNSFPVPYTLMRLRKTYGPYRKGSVWAEPDEDACAEYMRVLAAAPEKYNGLCRRAGQDIRTIYSKDKIAAAIDARLQAAGIF